MAVARRLRVGPVAAHRAGRKLVRGRMGRRLGLSAPRRPRRSPRSGSRVSAGRSRRRSITDLWADHQSASVRSLSLEAAGPAQGRQSRSTSSRTASPTIAIGRDLFRMPLDGSSLTPVSTSRDPQVGRGAAGGGRGALQAARSAATIILLLARHGGLQSADAVRRRAQEPHRLGGRVRPGTLGTVRGAGSGSAAATTRAIRSGRAPRCATASSPRRTVGRSCRCSAIRAVPASTS